MLIDWKETRLWQELQKRESAAQDICAMLTRALDAINPLLGDTAPYNFTLHDRDHSFRVAERMVDLLPDDLLSRLSSFELALLLLSAYLHDIGMSPNREKIKLHFQFLLDGPPQEENNYEKPLSLKEQGKFQEWLDDTGTGIVPPLPKTNHPSKDRDRAEELIAYYTRERHNDWSEEWVREHAALFQTQPYPQFLDHLVQICRSHHEGYEELTQPRFEPRLIRQSVIHLRYLAALLRLADVLENDPERTPQVLLDHRNVSLSSMPYWQKDHYFSVVSQENGFLFTAETPTAELQYAVGQQRSRSSANYNSATPWQHSHISLLFPVAVTVNIISGSGLAG